MIIRTKGGINLYKLFKEKRNALGMTQTEVAVAVGVSLTSYQLWERGASYPNEENQIKLFEVLNIKGDK